MIRKLGSIFVNGLRFGIVFFVLSFVLSYYVFKIDLQRSLFMSVTIGGVALIINGLIYSRFSKSAKVLDEIIFNIDDSESISLQCPANHIIEDSSVPGKLFLTNQRMVFIPFDNETWPQEYAWSLTHLKAVDFSRSLWNAGGEFLMKTEAEPRLIFEVDKIKPWKQTFQKK